MKKLLALLNKCVRYSCRYLRSLSNEHIKYILSNNKINIIVGAGYTRYKGWLSTDRKMLDVTKIEDFERLFHTRKINKILAEHVLEHLNNKDLKLMAANFFRYSSEDVNIRIAVPDGFHKDIKYIEAVKPFGTGEGSDDHKHLFNYRTLPKVFEEAGFKSNLIEHWDENNVLHSFYKNDEKGYITRSLLNDKRNKDGNPNYTSLIIDFTK